MIEPKEYKDVQGVYMIVQPDGRYYIGSSVDLYNRLRAHKSYFSPKSRDYKRIKYTCKWPELRFYILKKTKNLSIKKLRAVEKRYLDLYWSDGILNIEKKSAGRSIDRPNNPNWLGGRCDSKVCKCGSTMNYRSRYCRSCSTSLQHKKRRESL